MRFWLVIFLIIIYSTAFCQDGADSLLIVKPDSSLLKSAIGDTSIITDTQAIAKPRIIKRAQLFEDNKFVNLSGTPEVTIDKERKYAGQEILFYLITGFLLAVALMRVFYLSYFNNIFKVFFNTSLRQNQLTDIILQARLASLIFNVVFVISAGFYIWLLSIHYNILSPDNFLFLPVCIIAIAIIYTIKYIVIKLLGWITGVHEASEQYIFIIFLINKILGLILIPLLILLAFAPAAWSKNLIVLSWLIIFTLFIIRYLRTYSLLGNKLNLSRFHFLIYLTGIEIIPLFVLFRYVFHVMSSFNLS